MIRKEVKVLNGSGGALKTPRHLFEVQTCIMKVKSGNIL